MSVFAPATILTELQLTNVLNDASNWQASTTHIRYQTGGGWTVASEGELAIDASPEGFDESYFPCKFPNAPHYKRGNISLSAWRTQLASYNRISLMVYPDMPDRAALWIEATGAPVWTAATFPLKPRQWNKIYLDLGHLTPQGRQAITRLMLGGTPLGKLPGDPQWFRYYLKDFRLEQVLPRNVAGWEISPRYVGISQVGFAPWHEGKRAIFSGDLAADNFNVRRAADDFLAYSGPLQSFSNELGRFRIADFTPLHIPGDYYAEAGNTRSVVFPISARPFRGAVTKYLEFLACMRSGCATAAHPDCFRDDAIREDNRQTVDLAGGWFDASDLRIYNSMSMTSILRPLALVAGTPADDPFLAAALRQEILWGAAFLDKLWDGETGLPLTALFVHAPRTEEFAAVPYYKNNNYWTDNTVGSADDRVVHTPWNSAHIDGVLDNYIHHLGICTAGAHYLEATPELAGTPVNSNILAQVSRHFQRLRDNSFIDTSKNLLPGYQSRFGTAALSLTIETAVALAAVTGYERYRDMAVQAADLLVARQQRILIESNSGNDICTGFFDAAAPYRPSSATQPVSPVDALIRLLQTDYAGENRGDYLAALKIYADLYVKKCYRRNDPYPLLPVISQQSSDGSRLLGKTLDAIATEYYSASPSFGPYAIGIESYSLVRLAALLEDRELQTIGLNLLQWQLGRNPSSYSLMAEVGGDYKPDMMSTALGHMPGMMAIGIGLADGEPVFPQHHGSNEIYTQLTPYAQALAQANANFSLEGTVTRAGIGASGVPLVFRNLQYGQEFRTTTDNRGEFGDVRLPAGLVFAITCDGVNLGEMATFAGTHKRVTWDLAGGCRIMGATAPARVDWNRNFVAEVELFAWGTPPPLVIEAHGYQVKPLLTVKTVQPIAGVGRVTFEFRPISHLVPFTVMFNRQGDHHGTVSAAGAVALRENHFVGHGAAWNNPSLWSAGRLPGAGDAGIIAGEAGSPRLARYVAGGDLDGPPGAIRLRPHGEMQLYDSHMLAEHNLVLAGGRLSTYNWYQCHSTITLEAESSVGARGTAWFYLHGRVQDGAITRGRLRIDNSTVELRSLLNTYSAGTVVGTNAILLTTQDNMIGTGSLTIEPGGTFRYGYDRKMTVTNSIVVDNGRLWGWNNLHSLTAPAGIKARGDLDLYTTANPQSINTAIADYDAATPGRVVKTGTGLFSFPATMTKNSYSGGTLIREGDLGLNFNANNVLGRGPVTVCSGGRLTFLNNNTETNLVILEDGGEITSRTGNPFATLSGTILLKGAGVISSTAPSYFSFTGKFKDYDAATKGRLIVSNGSENASSQLRLNTTDQEYSGGTHVKKGLVHAPSMPSVGTVRVEGGAHLLLTTTTDHALGGLAGNGEVELRLAQGATLTCNEGLVPGVRGLAGDILTITGATGRVVIDAGATSVFRLNNPGNHDKVMMRGGVALTLGGTLRIESLGSEIASGRYSLFELFDGALPCGAFDQLEMPGQFTGKVLVDGSKVLLLAGNFGTILELH